MQNTNDITINNNNNNELNGTWFDEVELLWPGQKFSLKIKEVLYKNKSKYQDITVFKSETYGNVLVLDGVIQVTERDEFSYQECISHIPLFCHPNPENVLIIGAGDGGVTREVVKHKCVKLITHVEIDEDVTKVSKEFFKDSLATGFSDPRVNLLFEDGDLFLKNTDIRYDVVIVDSGDPVGPNVSLFEQDFYSRIKNVLKPNGIMCCQGENIWLHLDLISNLLSRCSSLFPVVSYAYTCIPTYPSGQIGFVICSLDPRNNIHTPSRLIDNNHDDLLQGNKLRYYSKQIHQASFQLPVFAENVISKSRKLPNNKDYYQAAIKAISNPSVIITALSITITALFLISKKQ